eukprot:430183_1
MIDAFKSTGNFIKFLHFCHIFIALLITSILNIALLMMFFSYGFVKKVQTPPVFPTTPPLDTFDQNVVFPILLRLKSVNGIRIRHLSQLRSLYLIRKSPKKPLLFRIRALLQIRRPADGIIQSKKVIAPWSSVSLIKFFSFS